jgi:6-phosphofructokinase
MRIGILTGGGDVPGLNPCIRALVYRAQDEEKTVIGIRRGWEGLLKLNPDDPECIQNYTQELNKQNTRTIDRTGGTILHTSRTNPSNVSSENVPDFLDATNYVTEDAGVLDFTPHVLNVLKYLNVDVLVPIGGDDTLSYGARLHREGFPIIAIPKTMDNDVFGTDYCIGFSTAVTRSVKFIHQLRTSSGSHERLSIIELFGRYSGETCLISAYLSATDRALISEVPFNLEKLAQMLVEDRSRNPSRYAMVAISEGARLEKGEMILSGATDAYGHQKLGGIGLLTAQEIKRITGYNTIYQQVTMDLIANRKFGRMVALKGGRYTHVRADTVTKGVKRVDVEEMYDIDNYRPRIRAVENKPMFLY